MTSMTTISEAAEALQRRYEHEVHCEVRRWRAWADGCIICGERIGHFGGSVERDPCRLIPQNLPLEEVRPNCYTVRRYWIGDAIRAVCDGRKAA